MLKLWFAALVLLAGCSTPSFGPRIVSIANSDLDYKVRVNFVLFQSEIARYPKLHDAFMCALEEWSSHLPIEVGVYEEVDNQPIVPFMPQPAVFTKMSRIVKVHFDDLQNDKYRLDDGTLGIFLYQTNDLVIDTESEGNDNQATYVMLHELGHAFGIPHIVKPNGKYTSVGYIVTPHADTYIMFPEYGKENMNAKLSDLEISIARKYCLQLTTGLF